VRSVIAAALSMLMVIPVTGLPSAFAADLEPVLIELSKEAVLIPANHALIPGEQVDYSITVTCSSTITDCINMKVTDSFPEPLVFNQVSASADYTIGSAPNGFALTFSQVLDEGGVGLKGGESITFVATATVPANVDSKFDADTITNTAFATVDNPDSNVSSAADVTLEIPTVIASTIDKTVTPTNVPGLPGTPVKFTLAADNSSNTAIDSLTVQDPSVLPTNAFDYLAITGLGAVTFPSGADRVQVDYYRTAWTTGSPSATAALPTGVDPATIKGLRFIFTSTTGLIARGATSSIVVNTEVTNDALNLTANFSGSNVASSQAKLGSTTGTLVADTAPFTIRRASLEPTATKVFSATDIIGGREVRVDLTGTNAGDFTVDRLSIIEPRTSTTSLPDQGLEFESWFTDDIEWPTGATAAAVSYLYDDGNGLAAPLAATPSGTWPAPVLPTPSSKVIGFRVDFTGTIAPGDYAVLPFNTTSVTVPSGNVTTTNTVGVEVARGAQTASAQASATLTRRSSRINTTVTKNFSPDSLYSAAGASTLVLLTGQVDPRPVGTATGGSTVGVTELVVGDTDADFFNYFDVAAIVATDVPANSQLTIRTRSGATWTDLPGAIAITGPVSFKLPITAGADRDAIDGIEFVYTPTGTLTELPPGFSVNPNLKVVLRDQLRDGSGAAADPSAPADVLLSNTGTSIVRNPVATPPVATDSDGDGVTIMPIDGDGPPMLSKSWADAPTTNTDAVRARSNDTDIATIAWGTGGLEYHSVVISDTASDPATTPVEDTVFEAFNLRRLEPITSSLDPLLTYDKITSVQLYKPGTGWVNTLSNTCAGNACDGTFPGYTLTVAEQLFATGVRFVFEESPTRAARATSATAPVVGSGVAARMPIDRRINLSFEVRDTRRSNGEAVLGITRGAIYNLAAAGEVNNTALIEGRDSSDALVYDDEAADSIRILDRAINVAATKTWTGGPFGVPPAGTPDDLFPRAALTITAQNNSVVRVNGLGLTEPSNGTNPFDYVNIVDIENITIPAGTVATSVVTLKYASAPDATFTIDQAKALVRADLLDVVGISVAHTGRINSTATTTITLDTQLRAVIRGTTNTAVDTASSPINNTVTATVTDPGGLTGTIGVDNVISDQASASVAVATFDYKVVATKDIKASTDATSSSPAIQYDGDSKKALVTLSGQTDGNVRTTQMVIEDSTPTFWNVYNFDSFGPGNVVPVAPANRVKVDALVGIDYVVSGNTITAECAGDPDLTDCWVLGVDVTTLNTGAMPNLGAGKTLADIRGLRFTYTKADYSAWERPFNPKQVVNFTVERRTNLVSSSATAVPSTLFTNTQATPGETTPGVFTNGVVVTASTYASRTATTPVWPSATATDSKQIRYQHLPARVQIRKTVFGSQSLGSDIPYTIEVTNRGGAHDKDLGSIVVTDRLPGDGTSPMLVIPNDPDTDLPYTNGEPFSYSLKNASGVAQPAPTVTRNEGTISATGRTLTFTMTAPATLPKGWTLTITTNLRFRDQLEAGTPVLNTATVTSDQLFDECDSFTNETSPNARTTYVNDCTSTTTVAPQAAAPVTIVKGVRGVNAGPLADDGTDLGFDDLGILKTVAASAVNCTGPNVSSVGAAQYYRYPCVPITRPGATEEWVSNFYNGGNIDVVKLVAIDVLPRANDRGVIVNEARSSRWTPTLTTYPTIPNLPSNATLKVYYVTATNLPIVSTRCNGADIQVEMGMSATSSPAFNTAYNSCLLTTSAIDEIGDRAAAWQLLSPSASPTTLASVAAMKFVIDLNDGLDPGQKLSIVYRSTTAAAPEIAESATGLIRDSIAYNSIAGAGVGLAPNGTTRVPNKFVIEPRKVGVAMATGSLQLKKVVDGLGSTFAGSNFTLTLACVSAGQSISLKNADGTARNTVSVPKNSATATVVAGIPLYANCTVSEDGYGQTSRTIVPATVRAEAARTTTFLVYDANPPFDDSDGTTHRPTIETSTVTNTYDLAGFTVSKTIMDGGADRGTTTGAVPYGNFQFSASCVFNNGAGNTTVLPTTTFTLATAAATRSFTGLPAGSVCTVTETQARNASATTTTVNTAATPIATGTARTFTLAADVAGASANTIEFTNTFAVGSLRITKAVTGPAAAAYGAGRTFTFTVSCSAFVSSTTTSTVTYTGTHTISPSGSPIVGELTIPNIARGSICTTTETGTAGATTTVASPTGNVTIGNSTTVTKAFTNRYENASLRVVKDVHQAAVDSDGNPLDRGFFDITVDCTFQGAAVYGTGYSAGTPMVLHLKDTEQVADHRAETITGLPSGASCTITEGATPGLDSSDLVVVTNGGTVGPITGKTAVVVLTPTTAAVSLNTVTINNRYAVSAFTLTKERLGGGAAQFGDGEFLFDVTCTAPGGIATTWDDVTLPTAGGSYTVTIEDIADGSDCSAIETNYASTGANAQVTRDTDGTVIAATATVPVTLATPGAITVENWYLTGAVTVTKTLAGDGSPQYSDGPFEVLLVCERDGDHITITGGAARTLQAGSMTTTYQMLPDGADCTLTETDRGGATTSRVALTSSGSTVATNVGTGYTFTVDVNDASLTNNQVQPALTVENTFALASLAVTKLVDSDAKTGPGLLDPAVSYGPFPVTVTCEFQGGSVYATGFDGSLEMQKDLAKDETWTLAGLPAGADCIVEETDAVSAVSPRIVTTAGTGTPDTNTGTTAAGVSGDVRLAALPATNTAVITNPYDVGSLELTKIVTGLGDEDWGDADFTITVNCLLTDGTGTDRVVWDESYLFDSESDPVLIENLATDAVCTITETLVGGADSTSIAVDGTVTAGTTASTTITNSTTPTDVVVTNAFPYSSVNVTKVIDGAGEILWGAGPFEVTLSCTRDVNGTDVVITIPGGETRALTAANGYANSYSELPSSAECELVENLVGGADNSTVDVPTFTLGAIPSEVVVTNTFDVGSIAVTKQLVGAGAWLWGNGPFEVTATCERDVNGVSVAIAAADMPGGATRELNASNGYAATFDDLPAKATCGLVETKTGGATATAISDSDVTIVGNAAVDVELTNTFDLGSLTLTKEVIGTGAYKHTADTFEVTLACQTPIDGIMTPIAIPGGNSRPVTAGEMVVFDNLPSDAKCDVAETADGGANLMVLTRNGIPLATGAITIAGGAVDLSMANVFVDSLAITGSDLLPWASIAAILVAFGIVLLVSGRRRRTKRA
jgi:fimbrial isopeptide formation D2 family protein